MKPIIEKTRQEREEALDFEEAFLQDHFSFYAVCDSCAVAFFKGDKILRSKDGYHCPLVKEHFWRNKPCRRRIYGGDEECFHKYYKFPSTKAPGKAVTKE